MKTNKQRTKRQHYVPRCYLGGFTKDGKCIWVFDKTSGRSFSTGLMNVAQETGFYDLPVAALGKLPAHERDVQMVEKALGEFDAALAETTRRLVREVESRGRISTDTDEDMAVHVVRQLLRTRRARNHLAESNTVMATTLFTQHLQKNAPHLMRFMQRAKLGYDEDALAVLQAQQIFDTDDVCDYAELLLNHIWVVGVNQTAQPFYTSDDPVVRVPHVEKPGHSFTGLGSPGIEIAFPLTSRLILIICERRHFWQSEHLDRRAVRVHPVGVERYNCLQVQQSYRQVYCETDQFEQARAECRLHPEVCKLDRPHVEVVREDEKIGFS